MEQTMIIDFDRIEEKSFSNFKEGKGEYISSSYVDDFGKIMRGRLEKGCSIGLHTHEANFEIMYVISGEGKLIYKNKTEVIRAGQAHYCSKGQSHSLINEKDETLVFLGIVVEQ